MRKHNEPPAAKGETAAELSSRDIPTMLGILLGWKRFPSSHGSIVRLQTARSMADVKQGQVEEHDFVLSALQLRQLGEDLIRAADEREGRTPTEKRSRWWNRL